MATTTSRATTSRTTSPELVDSLVELSFAVQAILTRASAHFDLSVTQLRLLGILRDRTPPMTAIAEHLGLDRSSVTGLVDRAERRGLVARTAATDDARVTLVRTTPAGRAVMKKLGTVITSEIGALCRHLTDADLDLLVRVAGSVLDTFPT